MIKSLGCLIQEIWEKVCNAEGDTDILNEILEKVCNIEEALLDPCPFEVVGEMTSTNVTLDGDASSMQPGDIIDLFDANGNVSGTAQVVSATYNAVTNTTAVVVTNVTAAPAVLASIKSVKGKFRQPATEEGDGKKEAVKR